MLGIIFLYPIEKVSKKTKKRNIKKKTVKEGYKKIKNKKTWTNCRGKEAKERKKTSDTRKIETRKESFTIITLNESRVPIEGCPPKMVSKE